MAYGPYGGAGYAARYNPTSGTYSRGGSWQKYGSGGWSNVERPTGTSGQVGAQARQLDHDRAARRDGAQRTSDLGAIRSRSTSRPAPGAGSYRPGGGFRGGGRRR